MKIKYLGTGAYEGVPALFCKCRVCRLSKESGGRNLRSRSQALINDEVLIDFNADTVWHYQRYGFDWEKIRACLITHSHCDHLYPEDIEQAARAFSHEHGMLPFYAGRDGFKKIKAYSDKTGGGATVTRVKAGERFALCGGKYSVLPLRANHSPRTSPLVYSISCEEKRMLYAHDTGVFFKDTKEGLKSEGRFDFISLDCTGCLGLNGDWINGHMSLRTDLQTIAWLREEKLVDDNTVIVLNHFSHNGGQTYDEMVGEAEKHGIVIAYDGLEIEF